MKTKESDSVTGRRARHGKTHLHGKGGVVHARRADHPNVAQRVPDVGDQQPELVQTRQFVLCKNKATRNKARSDDKARGVKVDADKQKKARNRERGKVVRACYTKPTDKVSEVQSDVVRETVVLRHTLGLVVPELLRKYTSNDRITREE